MNSRHGQSPLFISLIRIGVTHMLVAIKVSALWGRGGAWWSKIIRCYGDMKLFSFKIFPR